MADQSIRFLEGITKDVLVQIQDHYVPADFMVMDMGAEDEETPMPSSSLDLDKSTSSFHMGRLPRRSSEI
jgi:hypothetical protein